MKFGRRDIPLDREGRDAAWSRTLPFTFTVVYTSELARAQETAWIISTRMHRPLVIVPALIERDHGDADGLTIHERAHRFPDGVVPGRESDAAVRHRAAEFLTEADPDALVVTHSGVIYALTGRKVDHLETVEWTP